MSRNIHAPMISRPTRPFCLIASGTLQPSFIFWEFLRNADRFKTPSPRQKSSPPKETVVPPRKRPFNPVMFPSPVTGKMYGPDCVGRLHKTLLKKAGITENIRFHDLRHTYATLAIQNGVDAKTVSSLLGHYSAGFTLDTYTHTTSAMQKAAADKVGSFIAQAV